jgi:hypothetical protein
MTAMIDTAEHPDIIGRTLVEGRAEFYGAKRVELDRSAGQVARILGGFHVEPGRYVLTVSLTQEVIQFAPFEQACTLLGLIGANADASPFDAARVESLVRQFDCAIVCGVDKAVLDGLQAIGHDAARIFAGRIVWARPDAFDAVAGMPDVTARRCAEIGPVLGLECRAADGMHIDGREWEASAPEGTIVLSSRMARIEPVEGFDTRLRGRVETSPCSCGSPDPRIHLD